ncbi:hypothetical protein GQ43DRAFT_252859 [Delitschia confertaspora ATCC 74209]|uniref:DUF4139 domain-containing protein n=1 Tax=Delitschia confertaspora ATCC 74209 TaxID=1513339 RepID=A0A9P4JHD6_9PLEO|nr:hypothetical protein GQ43DRAFT_252859 [Delitschia confertaspora ATCC 74209]
MAQQGMMKGSSGNKNNNTGSLFGQTQNPQHVDWNGNPVARTYQQPVGGMLENTGIQPQMTGFGSSSAGGSLFGTDVGPQAQLQFPAFGATSNNGGLFRSAVLHAQAQQPTQAQAAGLFGAANFNTVAQERPQSQPQDQKAPIQLQGGGLFGSRAPQSQPQEAADPFHDASSHLGQRLIPPHLREPAIEFEEPTWEDNGLTTRYEVPGRRTLAPSSTSRRHKIATLTASNISLSHICVPKLRSAAFLRAKIRNPSSAITLLKGSAGVTLDGSFLGNMILPLVSPGGTFELSLGVDTGVTIAYPKPIVKKSTQGMLFSKESAQEFKRSVWVTNTKSVPVEVLIKDQIPISAEERLRIIITTPKGLVKEGDEVGTGEPAKDEGHGKGNKGWGTAVAKLKKGGEVDWNVKLEKGEACLLKLEYEARLPGTEKIVPA